MISMPMPTDGLALRTCRLFETRDLDDARDRISRVMQPHRLRPDRADAAPHSHMDFLRLQGLAVGTIKLGGVALDVPPLADYLLVVFCLSGSGLLRADREEVAVDRFQAIVCAPNQALTGQLSADCEQFFVRIDKTRLAEISGRRTIRLGPRLDLRQPRLQPWLTTLRNLVADPITVGLIRADARVAADYEQLLLRLLLAAQEEAPPDRPRGHVRPASVHRAIGYIEAHASAGITMTDIAEAAGVPERTLHDAFRRFEGVSPMRYLRDLRLDRTRARLLAGGVEGSVTATALGAGFSHLGRFAQDYQERFGERPSETLRRG